MTTMATLMLAELRCPTCGSLLAKVGPGSTVEIKCRKDNTIVRIAAST